MRPYIPGEGILTLIFFQSLLEEIYGEPVMGTPTPAQFLKNSSRFTNEQDLNKHTRMRAFEAVVPRTKKVENFQVIALSNAGGKFANPLQSRSIPSWSNLQEWSAKLRQSPGRCIQVQEGGEIVLHNISTLKTAQLLHEIRVCKDAVERELTFFSSPKNTPRSIQKKIDVETMTSFRELVHYSLSTEPIKEYDMLPGDLARLCGSTYLSDSHLTWIAKQLNTMQSYTHVVFANYIADVETYCHNRMKNDAFSPSKLILMFCVGALESGDVFIARDRDGGHFSVAVYDDETGKTVYGDSAGWKYPEELLALVNRYVRIIFEKECQEVIECHASAQTYNHVHSCSSDCNFYYPLQTDGDICGVVVSVIASIVALAPLVWEYILSVKNNRTDSLPYYFIKEPTKYNKFLRCVLIMWFMKKYIDIEYIVPRQWLFGNDNAVISSDSEEELDLPRVEKINDDDIADGSTIPIKKRKEETNQTETPVAPNDAGQFICHLCSDLSFTRKYNFKRHMMKKHPEIDLEDDKQHWRSFCYECGERFYRVPDLKCHLSTVHGYVFATEVTNHDSVEEYLSWKEEIERQHNCSFVVPRGHTTNKDGETVQYLVCNRSGFVKLKTDSKRRSKSCGTRKIDNNCTASMKVTIHNNNSVSANLCLTHYGHENELQHLNLPKGFRQQIAAKLKLGVNREKILDDIRDNVGEKFSREHMLDEQDLRNIAKQFGLSQVQRHDDDQTSVLSWIHEWEGKDRNPVLYYKMQGDTDDQEHRLASEDFIIILQTNAQKNMMTQFASKGVCCDTTHGTTGYDFKLATLIVLDEFQEGLPVAHCLANRETYAFMELFFEKLVINTETTCSPVYFMSDTAPQFYDAFSYVNGCQPLSLFCTWHVDKAWRENLREHIPSSPEVQDQAYKYLIAVRDQTDQATFESMLHDTMHKFQLSSMTQSFAVYFQKEWLNKRQSWGYAYRVGLGINTNMFCESWHKHFKYKYLKGKINRRVDECLLALVKCSRDMVFKRINKMKKGKISNRIKRINTSHNASCKMPFTKIKGYDSQDQWLVESEDGTRIYQVKAVPSEGPHDCRLNCFECNVCIHQYSCQCVDHLLYTNICKHIHLLCRFIKANGCKQDQPKIEDEDRKAEKRKEMENLIDLVADKENDNDFNAIMATARKELEKFTSNILQCTQLDKDALLTTITNIRKSNNTLEALKKHKKVEKLQNKIKGTNNKVVKQRFFTTKKKTKTRKKNVLAKPTQEEKDTLFEDEDWLAKLGGKKAQIDSNSEMEESEGEEIIEESEESVEEISDVPEESEDEVSEESEESEEVEESEESEEVEESESEEDEREQQE